MPYVFINGPVPAVDHEAVTVSTSAIGFTATKILVRTPTTASADAAPYQQTQRADEALVTVDTNPIRVMFHGGTPTNATGHKFNPGDSFTVTGYSNLANLLMIQDVSAAGSATVRVTYFRRS